MSTSTPTKPPPAAAAVTPPKKAAKPAQNGAGLIDMVAKALTETPTDPLRAVIQSMFNSWDIKSWDDLMVYSKADVEGYLVNNTQTVGLLIENKPM